MKTQTIRLLVHRLGQCFSQNTVEIVEGQMVSSGKWNSIILKFFFVLEEALSDLSWHHIKCGLYLARTISSVCKMSFCGLSLLLESSRDRTDATDSDGQTFKYNFESLWCITTGWHKLQMRVDGLSVENELNFPVAKWYIIQHYWRLKFSQLTW